MAIMLIVKGAGSRGKTSTLKKLINLLIYRGANIYYKWDRQYSYPNDKDWFIILSKEDRKIGIITFGDPGCEDDIADALEESNQEGVDIIIAASRTCGEIYDTLLSFAGRKGFTTIETGTLVLKSEIINTDREDALNKICAQYILNIINHADEIEKS